MNIKTVLALSIMSAPFFLNAEGESQALKETGIMCQEGSSSECYSLGALYLNGAKDLNISKDTDKSILPLKKSCTMGGKKSERACSALGGIYSGFYGEKTKDEALATEYFGYACILGAAEVCHDVGSRYENGESVEKSLSLAKKYYLAGCVLKDEKSCGALDRMTSSEEQNSSARGH